MNHKLFIIIVLLFPISSVFAQYEHQQDIIYGYKDGMALVMDAFIPTKNPNGASVVFINSGGMLSNPTRSHRADRIPVINKLIESGFVVFSVSHGSQPKYNADEIRYDISRAIRFIKFHAGNFGVDLGRIGIMGRSSGGHLALMAALAPVPADLESSDPVNHESAKVQSVIAYFPSTDLLDFGEENTTIIEHFHTLDYYIDAAFDFHVWDTATFRFERIADTVEYREWLQMNSPVSHVTEDDPPLLIFHGDKDVLVPIQQSELMINKYISLGLDNQFVIAIDKGHGWDIPLENEFQTVLGWFGKYLLNNTE